MDGLEADLKGEQRCLLTLDWRLSRTSPTKSRTPRREVALR